MNVNEIETAAANALGPMPVTVLTATGDQPIPTQESFIIASVEQCENLVGPLWKATVSFIAVSPAPQMTRADHDALVAAMTAGVTSGFDARYSAPGHAFAGKKLLASSVESDDSEYRHRIAVLIGLQSS